MEVVVDTSVVVAVMLNEAVKPILIERVAGMELVAPSSLHWEIGNALASLSKRGRMDFKECVQAFEAYEEAALRFVDVALEGALEIAYQHSIYAYDAYVIACATEWELPLLTLDANQAKVARSLGIVVMEVER